MYKGFISRYPEYSIPLVIQIIDSANITEVRVHKKVLFHLEIYFKFFIFFNSFFKKIFALMTLSQTINNQMVFLLYYY